MTSSPPQPHPVHSVSTARTAHARSSRFFGSGTRVALAWAPAC